MPRWNDREHEFALALLDPRLPIPLRLTGPDGEASSRRFAVYRNNVAVSLIGALEANFPAVCRIVGEEFFRAMARAHVITEPPVSPILLEYGAGFPNFIAGFEPAATVPYLADVARIERAWAEAYHAREAVALDPAALAAITPGQAAGIRLAPHPSLRTVRSQFPALTIWRMNVGDGVPRPVDLDSGGEDALLIRPGAEVEVRAMPQGGAEFVAALASGNTLAQAAQSALVADPFFDLAANLAALIGAGVFVGYRLTEDRSADELGEARHGALKR